MGNTTIYVGDNRMTMAAIPDASVHMVLTSPPYWKLRNYEESDGEIGQEDSPDCLAWARGWPACGRCYVCVMREVFSEVWRILRDDGVLMLNLGDSLYSTRNASTDDSDNGLKPKDLVGIPWRVAFALQSDGFFLRSDIVWAKGLSGQGHIESRVESAMRSAGISEDQIAAALGELSLYNGNSMPEPVTDRPVRAHEYLFLMTKRPQYYWDTHAIGERVSDVSIARISQNNFSNQTGGDKDYGKNGVNPNRSIRKTLDNFAANSTGTRNIRDVWALPTRPFREAHFATMSPYLAEMAIKSATSEHGACSICGTPFARMVSKPDPADRPTRSSDSKMEGTADVHVNNNWQGHPKSSGQKYQDWRNQNPDTTYGWRPGCTCGAPAGVLPDDVEVIHSPIGESGEDDPSIEVGRAGFARPRQDTEGRRPITRYEQRAYAKQIKDSPHYARMADEAGTAISHYTRTDRSGARPVPEPLLGSWIDRGWLVAVEMPEWEWPPVSPCVVFDPFGGSGRTAAVAMANGRDAVLCELSDAYAEMSARLITDDAPLLNRVKIVTRASGGVPQ